MDKIREEFEKINELPVDVRWDRNKYVSIFTGNDHLSIVRQMNADLNSYRKGHKSRDEEIKHLEQDCKNLITVNKNQDVIMQFRTDHVKELYHQVCIHKEKIKKLEDTLGAGRDYLMTVKANDITVEDCLEAFGFGRNGLKENE